ncbi:ICOS ligand isoform X1 [Elephas maximus indicus]|uniref:ICOS ligand isoform X1 n=1 Tax=Elephas maximus indicus TaxID=99487 RepID=UPI0021169137|nr:ICOS ligand isoform X1 [Elephas maximus indicus]
MRLRRPGLLLLLFVGLQADIQKKEVQGIVGSSVELSCIYPGGSSFDLNDFFIYWQTNEPQTVVAYLSENSSWRHEDNRYQHRAQLSLDSMKRGNFSLHLYNITPQDEQTYQCLVFSKPQELKKVWEVDVILHVAANYSMPIVSTPIRPSQDEELTFTCRSTNGYPRPNVYWINQTDNSLLDKALQNSTVSMNEQGLYDVVSTLRVQWAPNVNVQCCIENVILHQNLTVSSHPEPSSGTNDKITDNPAMPREKNMAVFIVFGILGVMAVVVTIWLYKNRCSRGSYTGAQGAQPELELIGHV